MPAYVSAVMPTYNRSAFVPMAIACFLNQDYSERELIVVDNGTETIRHLIPNDSRIHYCRQDSPRLTHGQMLNRCCERANGDVIVNWDDDDWSAPDRMTTEVDLLLGSEKSLAGFHSILYYDVANQGTYRYSYSKRHDPRCTYAAGSSQIYKKSYWQKHQFENVAVGADSRWSLKAQSKNELASMNGGKMLVALAHGANVSNSRRLLGNTPQFPKVDREEFPTAFWDDLKRFRLSQQSLPLSSAMETQDTACPQPSL